jgi:outer membrane protein TolC
MKRRFDTGIVAGPAVLEAEVELLRARAALATLMERRSLRREFLEKGTAADELALRLESTQLRQEVTVAEQSLRLAKARLNLLRKQMETGVATRLELMRAEVRMQETELELRQLLLRLKRLDDARQTPEPERS